MTMITVVLMDKDNVSQHASGKIDFDKVYDTMLLERNKRLYSFIEVKRGVVFYRECDSLPYVITEF